MKRHILSFVLLISFVIAGCVTTPILPTPSPQATFVPPAITRLEPATGAPGDKVHVVARGGYDFIPPSGYIESARGFPILFDGKPAGTATCQAGACLAQIIIPNDAAPGTHIVSIEGGTRMDFQVVAVQATPTLPPQKVLPPRPTQPAPQPPAASSTAKANASPQTADTPNTYWVANPTSGARLLTQLILPKNASGKLPALVLVPGGVGWGGNFLDPPGKAQAIADAGFAVIVFDPDGRGKSGGKEDYDGFTHQDGLAAIIRFAATLPQVDATRIGLVSYSYGVTMATGVLARYGDLPIRFYIDWEGPVDRNYTTTGCRGNRPDGIQWQPCTDNAWWSEREAINFIAKIRVPYQRVQSEKDHVQSDNSHAIAIVNAAVQAKLSFVRLNDYAPNQAYDPKAPPAMFPESQDRQLEQRIAKYAQELFTK